MGQQCSVKETPKRKSARERNCLVGGMFTVPNLNVSKFGEEYQEGQALAEKVAIARNKLTKRIDVVYKLPKAMSPCTIGQEVSDRIKQVMTIEHPNVCRLIEAFDDHAFVYVIYVKIEGMILAQWIQKTGLNERKVADIIFQVVRALSVCDALQPPVRHGALAPKNIMLDSQGTVTINDLGLIGLLKPDPIQKLHKETLSYLAPEILEGWVHNQNAYDQECKKFRAGGQEWKNNLSSASDVWSVGVILFHLMTGKLPFHGNTLLELAQSITTTQPRFMKKLEHVSKVGIDLVTEMMSSKPGARPQFKDLVENRWLSDTFRHELSQAPFDAEVAAHFLTAHRETNFKKCMMRLMSEKLPPTKIKQLESTFNAIDKNHDGMVSYKELKHFCKKNPEICDTDDLEKMWEDIDADKSGQISIHEFVASTLDTQGIIVHDVLWKTFSALDTNHNGKLTRSEIKAALRELNMRLGEEHIQALTRLVDEEVGSGEITFHEFCALMHEEGARERRTACCCTTVAHGSRTKV